MQHRSRSYRTTVERDARAEDVQGEIDSGAVDGLTKFFVAQTGDIRPEILIGEEGRRDREADIDRRA